jgi:UDP-N-acetylmuramoyl-tripeptide--D-alanyl-D-alanine ligase
MGARHVGDIKELCDLVHPKHGLITAVGNQHLETFGSPENVRKTKYELADSLPTDGLLYVNWDCDAIRQNPPSRPYITYGLSEGCDYRAVEVEYTPAGTTFAVIAPDGQKQTYRTSLIGEHSVLNLTGAIAFCHGLGIPMADLAPAVRKVKGVPHRMQLLPGPITYIDDAYNSNPAGFRGALDTLAAFDAQRVLVTPGMVELGERQDALNRELGEYAATRCDYAVLVGEKQAPPLREGLLAGGFPEKKLFVAKTLQEGLTWVNALPTEGQRIVLLENDLPDNFM